MSSIMIVNLDGTKTPTTREQLIQMAKSGVLMPDAKVDVFGRIVPARKIQDLIPIFEERERQAIERGINASSGLPVPNNFASTSFPAPPATPTNSAEPENSPAKSNVNSENTSRQDSATVSTSEEPKSNTLETRARARAGDCLEHLGTMCGIIQFVGILTVFACFVGCAVGVGFDDSERGVSVLILSIATCFVTCLALYFLHSFVRAIYYYVLKRAEDSIRQEDFNHDVMRQLNEIKERLGQE